MALHKPPRRRSVWVWRVVSVAVLITLVILSCPVAMQLYLAACDRKES